MSACTHDDYAFRELSGKLQFDINTIAATVCGSTPSWMVGIRIMAPALRQLRDNAGVNSKVSGRKEVLEQKFRRLFAMGALKP